MIREEGAGMTFLLVLGAVAGTVAAVSVRDAAHRWSELAGGRPGFESEYSARGRVEVIAGLRARAPALHTPCSPDGVARRGARTRQWPSSWPCGERHATP